MMTSDILITHSYLLKFDPKQWKIGQPYAPLGTLYAASCLRNHFPGTRFCDPMFWDGPEEFVPVIEEVKPKILVIYDDGFNYLTKMCLSNMREAAFRMMEIARESTRWIIVCSSDANDNYQLYFDRGADFCILGEGEITIMELVHRLMNSPEGTFEEIKGIAWSSPGGLKVNKHREILTDLDSLPFPAWDLLDVEKYRSVWIGKNGYFTMNMVTTRGCPYQCIWCAKPIYSNHYNSRSPANVTAEMMLLKERYAPDEIWFADDIFALKPGWIDEFEKLVHLHRIRLPYTIQTRVDLLLDNRQIKPLAGSGCRKAWLGIESGSQKILDAMKKGTTVEQIYTASPKLRAAGIEQAFFLQLGFPGETKEDIAATIRLLIDLMPDDIGISVTYPLPGTKFYDAVKADIRSKTHWTDSDDLDMLFNSNFSTGYYKTLHRYIHKYFRFRQSIYFYRNLFKPGNKTIKIHIKRMALLPYYFLFTLIYKLMLIQSDNK
jgi:anaerobic magnesium-protoporphyrin IX monomethyl ester cyclase